MDSCLNLKLNLAHQQDRKSLRYFNSGNIETAILCHKRACEYILDALKSTESLKAKESLELQYQYHLKQQDIVRIKDRISQNRTKAKEMEKESIAVHEESQPKVPINQSDELRTAILKRMTENDSLLSFLNNRGEVIDPIKMTRSDTQLLKIQDKNKKCSIVNNADILEELEMNNRELKKMVNQLCEELEDCQKERNELKETVSRLEKQLALVAVTQRKPCDELFSPFCELTPGGGSRELPALAPLELPNFDYDSMKK